MVFFCLRIWFKSLFEDPVIYLFIQICLFVYYFLCVQFWSYSWNLEGHAGKGGSIVRSRLQWRWFSTRLSSRSRVSGSSWAWKGIYSNGTPFYLDWLSFLFVNEVEGSCFNVGCSSSILLDGVQPTNAAILNSYSSNLGRIVYL